MAEALLYRCGTPTDWLCPCGRVARELAARGIEAEVRRVPRRRRERTEVEELTGQRNVPVLVLGREAICDSRRIVQHLVWRDSERGADERQRASSVDHPHPVRR